MAAAEDEMSLESSSKEELDPKVPKGLLIKLNFPLPDVECSPSFQAEPREVSLRSSNVSTASPRSPSPLKE